MILSLYTRARHMYMYDRVHMYLHSRNKHSAANKGSAPNYICTLCTHGERSGRDEVSQKQIVTMQMPCKLARLKNWIIHLVIHSFLN